MRTIKNKLKIVVLIILIFSCNSTRETDTISYSSLIENLSEDYPLITKSGWQLVVKSTEGRKIYYELTNEKQDTTEVLTFYYLPDSGKILMGEYYREIESSNIIHTLSMHGHDTTYYYLEKGNKKEFKIGEYNYRFENSEFKNIDEVDYYLIHKDSLSKIKGTGLPDLPTQLNSKDKVKLDSME